MLDKVGGQGLPATENETAQQAATTGGEAMEILAPQGSAAPIRKRSVFVSIILVILQAVLMVAILAASYMLAKRMIDDKPEPRKRRAFKTVYTIETTTAKMADHQPIFTAYGQTVAARSVDLRALVSGEIVQVNPKLKAGARVAKGEALLVIDEFNYRGALAEAEANYLEAEARVIENEAQIALEKSKMASAREQLQLGTADLARVEKLRATQTATQQQVEVRKFVVSQRRQAVSLSQDTIKVQEARIAQLKASLLRLKWRVNQAQRNLESTKLVAPFAGIVRSSSAEMGRNITANDVVVSMYEADTMEVKFTLTDAQYGRLQTDDGGLIGRKLDVIWSVGGEDWTYPATIDRIGAEITSSRGGVELFALIGDTPQKVTIRPGAFVEIRVPDRLFKDAIVVPDTAIYGTETVYTAVEGKLVENKVKIVAFEGENALIGSGLQNGAEVMVTRITEVSAGLNVRLEGQPDQQRSGQRGGANSADNAQGAAAPAGPGQAARRGPPSPEEIAKVAKANNLSAAEFRALARDKRRELIGAYRAANP